jgi:AmiR/NasT family two-component response regulator
LSVPLVVGGRGVGALNLYSRRAGGLPEADRFRARQFAGQAAGAVALALRLREREERAQHLETALRSRSTIDQALGVLVAQLAISPDEAFDLLRKQSQHTNRKLRDIAAHVIEEAAQRRP